MNDQELIEWVANAQIGEALPEPFRSAGGINAMFDRLYALGCPIEYGRSHADLVPIATRWARDRLGT